MSSQRFISTQHLLAAAIAGWLIPAFGADANEGLGQWQTRAVLEPLNEAVLSSEMAGRIVKMPVREGKPFNAGDLLVEFDCSQQEAEAAAARADHRGAQIELASLQELASMRSTGRHQVDLAAAKAERTGAMEKAAAIAVRRCRITAPYAGRVETWQRHPFETVAVGEELIRILDDQHLQIKVIFDAQWLRWVGPGLVFSLTMDNARQPVQAQMTELVPRVDAVSQSIKALAKFTGGSEGLLAGMSGTAFLPPPEYLAADAKRP